MQWKDGLSQNFVPAALIEGMCRFLVVRFLFPLPCGFIVLTQKEQKKNWGAKRKMMQTGIARTSKTLVIPFFLIYYISLLVLIYGL